MQIFLKTLTCKHVALQADSTDRIDAVKATIQDKVCIKLKKQRPIFAGKQLQGGNTLQDDSVQAMIFYKCFTFHESLAAPIFQPHRLLTLNFTPLENSVLVHRPLVVSKILVNFFGVPCAILVTFSPT